MCINPHIHLIEAVPQTPSDKWLLKQALPRNSPKRKVYVIHEYVFQRKFLDGEYGFLFFPEWGMAREVLKSDFADSSLRALVLLRGLGLDRIKF